MPSRLPSGRYRGRIYDRRTRRQVSPHTIIGGPATYPTAREAVKAEIAATETLAGTSSQITVAQWRDRWLTDPVWQRKAESTNLHRAERTKQFAARHGHRTLTSIDQRTISDYLAGGRHRSEIQVLSTMFQDATQPIAGNLIAVNPWRNLGIPRSHRGRGTRPQPPDPELTARMLTTADQLTPPSFAAYLYTAVWTGARPGELDGLQWADVSFDERTIRIDRQWNAKSRNFTAPKYDSRRTIGMVPELAQRLAVLPRESEFVFTTLRGHHYTPSTRSHHWNRVRCSIGIGQTTLYLCTRHYFGWYALNVLKCPEWQIAEWLGHDDGGREVRRTYGHSDATIAVQAIRDAMIAHAQIVALPVSRTDAR